MCPHGYRQCWRPRIEAWKESMQPAQGSSACQPWGSQKRERGTCLCILMKRKGLHTGFLLGGEGLRRAACLPSRRKARVPCPDQSSKSRGEERAVAEPAGGSQHGHPSHRDGDDHLHLCSQNAELSSKPPRG